MNLESIKKVVESLNKMMEVQNIDFNSIDKILQVLSDESGYNFRIVNRHIMYVDHSVLYDATEIK